MPKQKIAGKKITKTADEAINKMLESIADEALGKSADDGDDEEYVTMDQLEEFGKGLLKQVLDGTKEKFDGIEKTLKAIKDSVTDQTDGDEEDDEEDEKINKKAKKSKSKDKKELNKSKDEDDEDEDEDEDDEDWDEKDKSSKKIKKSKDKNKSKDEDDEDEDTAIEKAVEKVLTKALGKGVSGRKSHVVVDGKLVKSVDGEVPENAVTIDVDNIDMEDWNALPEETRNKIVAREFKERMFGSK